MMRSMKSHRKRRAARVVASLQAALLASSLIASPSLFAADTSHESHRGHATPVSGPVTGSNWQETLKAQTKVEDALEGRAGRSEVIEMQHNRLMRKLDEQMVQDAQAHQTSGVFNGMSTMHQYMGQDGSSFLLMSDNKVEPVSTTGGRCPAGVPVKNYDISMINVEISLNRWLDYYPGYMYALTNNLDKIRAEEAKNKAAREIEGFDPGAVTTGLQGDMIQPLVIRANQGDCVKIALRNQMADESGSLHIQSAGMVISATGKAATTTNPDSVVAPGKSVEMEWYIPSSTQEGVRQFHSYSSDR
ncbi:MAG: hypothetical protein ACKOCD_04260 [Nitrospiraceae bacterium]